MRKIDTHCHIFAEQYIEELRKRGLATTLIIPEWESAEDRIAKMDMLGIERQVLSQSVPFCYFEDDDLNRYLAQVSNDSLAEVCRKYPDRFSGFITVPLRNVKHAVDELKRAIKAAGMVGVVLGSHLGGKLLDSPELMPFYEEVNKLGLPVLIHPMVPAGVERIQEYQELHISTGFLFETTMALIRMAFRGIFEKYENINMIASHLGGTLPYVYHSIDEILWTKLVKDGKETCPPRPPGEYFKKFYADTGRPLKSVTLQCALALFNEDHILYGSDIPHMDLAIPRRNILKIEEVDLSAQTKEKIFFRNAERLFKL